MKFEIKYLVGEIVCTDIVLNAHKMSMDINMVSFFDEPDDGEKINKNLYSLIAVYCNPISIKRVNE